MRVRSVDSRIQPRLVFGMLLASGNISAPAAVKM